MNTKTLPNNLTICLDEAGRGPLAGPVCVGASCSLKSFDKSPFKDSKVLSSKQRESLFATIDTLKQDTIIATGRGMRSAIYIDNHGIIDALHQSCCAAIFSLLKSLYQQTRRHQLVDSVYGEDTLARIELDRLFAKRKITPRILDAILTIPQSVYRFQRILIDGNHTFRLDQYFSVPVKTIIKGDQKNPMISLASIVAKVTRDHRMQRAHRYLPSYKLDQHKGYGTVLHRKLIKKYGCSPLHRKSFCTNITQKTSSSDQLPQRVLKEPKEKLPPVTSIKSKPDLLLHICCAPDLTWPLHRLKQHFKLHLFWYNPNIHPRQEHTQRYAQFLKLLGLEEGDYEILEDRYDPKEFFDAMFEQRETIKKNLVNASRKYALKVAGDMEERSDRCNPCYAMRLEQAAKTAAANKITYFTSTLLISPKKKMDKLFNRGCEAESRHPTTKFLRFDFIKNDGYTKAVHLTKKHDLRRQKYCGCGWTIKNKSDVYSGG